jgi:hypothetical protein
LVNFSNQLSSGETKVVYISDNSFIGLCVKDQEIGNLSEFSLDCSGSNEYNFTLCLNNDTGYQIGDISCYDEGSNIRIENLTHSAVLGYVLESQDNSGGSSNKKEPGIKGCTYNKSFNWECSSWGECVNGTQVRSCLKYNNCGNDYLRPDTERNCKVKTPEQLFDITWDLRNYFVSNLSDLIGIATFESFGTVPTPVYLAFSIINSSLDLVYSGTENITVLQQEIFKWNFMNKGIPRLKNGEYTAVLTVEYNNLSETFEKNFIVSTQEKFSILSLLTYYNIIIFLIILALIIIFCYLSNYFV